MDKTKKTAAKPVYKRNSQVPKKQKHTLLNPINQPLNNILELQRTLGNKAVTRLFNDDTIQALRSGGRPLLKHARTYFESRFGYNLKHVRIHTDSRAAYWTAKMNAKAFTLGPNIAFGAGQYTPGSTAGRKLLAHELVHVVQQAGNRAGRPTIQLKRKDEEEVFNLVNKARGENLKWSGKLYNSAQGHSKWMHKTGRFVHKKNLKVKGYDLLGENIGTGFKKSSEVVQDWMNSKPHRENIQRPEFEEAAVGIAGKGVNRYATQHFGAVNPKVDYWSNESKQSGGNWTHIVRGIVSDNLDSPDKLRISIQNVKGNIVSLPNTVNASPKGEVKFSLVSSGIKPVTLKIITTDSHGNSSDMEVTTM